MREYAAVLGMLLFVLAPRAGATEPSSPDLAQISPPMTGPYVFLGIRSSPMAPQALTYLSLPLGSRAGDQVPSWIVYVFPKPLEMGGGKTAAYSTVHQVWDCKRKLAFGARGTSNDTTGAVLSSFSYEDAGETGPKWPIPTDAVGRMEFEVLCRSDLSGAAVVGDLSTVFADARTRHVSAP